MAPRSAHPDPFYAGLETLALGAVEGVFARSGLDLEGGQPAKSSAVRRSIRIVGGAAKKEALVALAFRIAVVLFLIPWLVGCVTLGWVLFR